MELLINRKRHRLFKNAIPSKIEINMQAFSFISIQY